LPKIRNSQLLKHHISLKTDDGQSKKKKKKKTVSVKFSRDLFSLLDFMNLEDGTDRSSRNIGKELPLNTTQYLRKAEISQDDSLMEALVWLHMVQFGVVQFDASYINLR
jgi:hypothetical protein